MRDKGDKRQKIDLKTLRATRELNSGQGWQVTKNRPRDFVCDERLGCVSRVGREKR